MKLNLDYRNLNMLLPDGSKKTIAYLAPEESTEMNEIKIHILKAVNNYDSMMDALNQCHNLFEAEYEDLSDQGKRVRQSVIAAILKATQLYIGFYG